MENLDKEWMVTVNVKLDSKITRDLVSNNVNLELM